MPKVMAQDSRIYAQAWDEIHYAKSLDKVVEALTRARDRLEHQPNLSVWLDSHAIDQLERFPHVNFSCPSKRRREDDLSWTTRCADALIDHVRPQQERLFNSAVTKQHERILRKLHKDLVKAEEDQNAYGYDAEAILSYLEDPVDPPDEFLRSLYKDVAWHQGHADPFEEEDVLEIYGQLMIDHGLESDEWSDALWEDASSEAEKVMRNRFDTARRMIQDAQNEISPPKGLPRTRGDRMRGLNALKRKLTSLP